MRKKEVAIKMMINNKDKRKMMEKRRRRKKRKIKIKTKLKRNRSFLLYKISHRNSLRLKLKQMKDLDV